MVKKIIGWLLFIFALVLLVMMYKNGMDFQAAVQQITGWFGQ